MNGKRIKLKKHATEATLNNKTVTLEQLEVITPERISVFDYLILGNKVRCL